MTWLTLYFTIAHGVPFVGASQPMSSQFACVMQAQQIAAEATEVHRDWRFWRAVCGKREGRA
jgi:hypothetical protein